MPNSSITDQERVAEPIAIIGMGCRFPGAQDVESFWRVLCDGAETVRDYPGARFEYIDRVYASRRSHNGQIATSRGGFLPDIDRFDADFFQMSPREAELLDPQQRLLLETAWEAIEDAGICAGHLAGSRTGVFIGIWTGDYEACMFEECPELDLYSNTGGGRYSASGRLAFFFDLRGPNLAIDTACSSSLVAVHLACESLRRHESEVALAGGVNVILRPEITMTFSRSGMLSPGGRCKFGDASADGYVRSEGAGVLVLKRLQDAVRDHDPIYAVIRASAVNNGGRSSGLLVRPSCSAQEQMIRDTLRVAGVAAKEVDYIEAHGTGTPAGDSVELEAIGHVMGEMPRERPCYVGSVKTNVGHAEAAAGMAGMVKTALALQRRTIPASLHFETPTARVAWSELPVAIQQTATPWPGVAEAPFAGVSGFGITGTNAHVLLQRWSGDEPLQAARHPAFLFVISGHTPDALEAVARSWSERLYQDPSWPSSPADLAYTAAVRRTHHDYRLTLVASDREQLKKQLDDWLAKEQTAGVCAGRRSTSIPRRVAFVFPGQGGQWLGMGRALYEREPVFREALEACDAAIRVYTGWSVIERLMSSLPEAALREIDVVQPCLFALMIGLAAVWRSWGIEPQAVVGHSMGEAAAAVVAGALTLDEGAAVICHRSRLMKRASGRGLMAVAELTYKEGTEFAAQYGSRISIGANNSPNSIVLSGDNDAVEDAIAQLERREVFCRRIKVDVASHCAHMDPFCAELEQALSGLLPRRGSLPLYSTTTDRVEDGSRLDARYWSRNLRQPVLFASAVQSLLQDGFDTFIEINAHPVLLQSLEAGALHAKKEATVIASLHRDQDDYQELLSALGALHVSGFPVDFRRLYPDGISLRLPVYPFQRQRFWMESGQGLRRRRLDEEATDRDKNTYEWIWGAVPAPALSSCGNLSGKFILAGSANEQTENFRDRLRRLGAHCVRVSGIAELEVQLTESRHPCRGVIWETGQGSSSQQAIEYAYEVVQIVQALVRANLQEPPRLWLFTRQAFQLPEGRGEVATAAAALWGLGRAIAREHPELRPVNVDLSATPTGEDLDTAAQILAENGIEEQLAVRNGRVFAGRFQNLETRTQRELDVHSEGTYLITGGLGGLGLQLAKWLAKSGARNLALMSRRSPGESEQSMITALERAGAAVRVFCADVADEQQVSAVLRTIAQQMPTLRGVFHLAAITENALVVDLGRDSLELVMRAKARGAWILHELTAPEPLDHFVMFSSIAATLSQPGQASYATANAFLDGLARLRRSQGLSGLSIQWGAWDGVGLAREEGTLRSIEAWKQQGIHPLLLPDGWAALDRLMSSDACCASVVPICWEKFAAPPENSQCRAFARKTASAVTPKTAEKTTDPIRSKLAAARPGDEEQMVLDLYLRETLAHILKTTPSRIDSGKPLGTLGVDSLMALEFVRRLSADIGIRIPVTAVFNYPTVTLFGAELARRLAIQSPTNGVTEREPVSSSHNGTTAAAITTLTEEEALEALLSGGGGRS